MTIVTHAKRIIRIAALLSIIATPALAQQRDNSARPDTAALRREEARLSPAQRALLQRIRESNLSREQIRQRLRDAGYDPNLADRYFDELTPPDTSATVSRSSRITQPLPRPSANMVEALRRIGILAIGDTLPDDADEEIDTVAPRRRAETTRSLEPQVFGRELFAATTQFEPAVTGPVDPDYRLGPGDELTLIVTGDVEVAYDLQVTREGYIVVPDIGQVLVNGLTMEQMKSRLNERLGRVYSGVQRGTAQFDVTIGKLRSKLIYVIGEVEVPGAYQLSGGASVFSALYRAGGPSINGSFRSIQVRRGNQIIRTVDLYSYLLKGDRGSDIRLEQGDVVFVPVVGSQTTVVGSVRRPAIYEMAPNEGLADAVAFAGGVAAQAAVERIQIDRILPPGQRKPGMERVLVDVALEDLNRGRTIPLMDGDRIRISAISDARRNRVAVVGDVQRPGEYEYRAGMTAKDLIDAAQGILPTAYTLAAQVIRLDPADSSTSMVRVSLDDPTSPDYAGNVRLQDLDEMVVFGRAKLANPRRIEIFGYVKNPGTYAYSEGMTTEDLILLAGGLKEGALDTEAEVARRVATSNSSDTLAEVRRVPIDLGLDGDQRARALPLVPLAEGDQVFIRRSPAYDLLSTVEITGEVVYPGPYTVDSKAERVSDIIARAGGLTPEAYARGFRLFRDGKPVAIDLPRALANRGKGDDLVIEPGDRLEVPRLDPTVLVTGAVQFESRIRYERGLSVQDYLERAGGVLEEGSASRATVRFPNGEVRSSTRTFGIRRYPRVEPGSTIHVPVRSQTGGVNWERVLTTSMTTLSALATIVLTIRAIN